MLDSVRMFTLKEPRRKSGTWDLLPYYNNLHTEYLAFTYTQPTHPTRCHTAQTREVDTTA